MLHKIKSDLICATCCSNKLLLLRQRFPLKFSLENTKGFVIITCGATCFSDVLPNLHTQSDFMDLSWQCVARQSIRPCLRNEKFCLFCEKISQREAISCASNIFHLRKVSQLSPDFKDAIH